MCCGWAVVERSLWLGNTELIRDLFKGMHAFILQWTHVLVCSFCGQDTGSTLFWDLTAGGKKIKPDFSKKLNERLEVNYKVYEGCNKMSHWFQNRICVKRYNSHVKAWGFIKIKLTQCWAVCKEQKQTGNATLTFYHLGYGLVWPFVYDSTHPFILA